MEQTVILYITKDKIKLYNKFPWKSYHNLPLWKKIFYYIQDNYYYTSYSIYTLEQIAENLTHLKPLLPNIKTTLDENPTALIKLVFSSRG